MPSNRRGGEGGGAAGQRGFSAVFLVLMGVGACSGIAAPRGAVPMVAVAPQDPFGGWAAVWEGKGYGPAVEGELIAIGPDSVFVLSGDSLAVRSLAAVKRVRVVGYDPKASDLMEWTGLGTVSTASHGIVSIFSAPLWLLIGGSITSGAAHASEFNVPGRNRTWDDLRPFARFPQGLPAGLDRSALKARPRTTTSH